MTILGNGRRNFLVPLSPIDCCAGEQRPHLTMSSTMQSARDVIDEPDSIPAIRNLRAKLHRALQQLAEEIYSDGIHFVLELVQNAEDNEYFGVTPELRFVVSPTCLLVLNNETGFGEPSVRAICDVSRSTKVKAKGHIGEKGIGFKSVFRITDEPQIFSNGYQFRLPKHDPDTGLGYVVPFWIEELPPQIDPGVTNILLPLCPSAQGELAKIGDIDSSLLLFLKQLQQVHVVDEVRGLSMKISRTGSDERIKLVKVVDEVGGGTVVDEMKHWKIVRREYPVRDGLREEKRKEITESELAIALPLTDTNDADGKHFHPVHAYLPIADYGLRFAFHADFVLAAGREGILTDRRWNEWLRDLLPELFVAAVKECKQDEQLRFSFLAYVPRPEDDIDPFFVPAAKDIRQRLREMSCVLTASGGWVTPSEALIADDALRAVLTNEDVRRLLGKEFVAQEFRADTKLLRCLGAADFTKDDLVKCLKAADWLAERPDEWLSRLFVYLGTQKLDVYLDVLRSLSIVPLEGGGLTSTATARGGVFFPLNRHRKYGFETGLLIVRGSILASSEKGQTGAVTQFLRQLGVKEASPVDLIREHIVPLFEAEDWRTTKDDDFRHGCIEYVKDHWEECRKSPGLEKKLKASLRLRIDGSNFYSRPVWMYLSKAFGNSNPLQALFRNIDDVWFVDSVYLKRAIERLKVRKARAKRGKVTRRDRQKLRDEWRKFFVDLGVETNIRVVPDPESDKPNEADSPHLKKLIKTGEAERITLALELLDADWDRYSRWVTIKKRQVQRGRMVDLGTVKTQFGSLLTDSAWIPIQGGGLAKPGTVFIDKPVTRDLLGDSVVYMADPVTNDGFIDTLGIHREPTVEAAIASLRHLADSGSRDRALFERLYTFLESHYYESSSAIDRAFWSEALIHIPTGAPRVLRADQVFWKDCSALFGDSRGYLECIYPHHRKFFRNQIEVPESPAPEDYADRLRELAKGGVADAACKKNVWAIYREFDRLTLEKKNRDEIAAAEWWKEFVEQPIFLTEDGSFVKREGVFANDKDEYAKLFRGQRGVALFGASPNRLPQVRHFLRSIEIRFLSQVVKQEAVVPLDAEPNESLTAQLRLLTPFLLRYLHHREPDLYDDLKERGKLGRLEGMRARMCEHPRARLILGGVSVVVERPAVVSEDTLYVRPDAIDDLDSLGIALALWLGNPKGLEDFLVSLLEKGEEEKMRRYLVRKYIPELPGEESEVIGEAVRSAEFGPSEATTESKPPEEEPAVLVPVAPEGRESLQGSQAFPSELPSADPIGSLSAGIGIPVNRGEPPPRTGGTGGITDGQITGSGPSPRPSASDSESRWPPLPPQERPLRIDWRQCEVEAAQVDWTMYDPPHPDGTRPIPPPISVGVPGQQHGPDDPADNKPERASNGESDDPPDVRSAVGRWGEEYTVRCLCGELLEKYPGTAPDKTAGGFCLRRDGIIVAKVIWLNQDSEQGVGYDIEVIEGGARLFVEVKSTRDDARACFDLSEAQWKLAQSQGSFYRITRVYNAGCSNARAVHIPNPYQAWQAGELIVRSLQIVL
jgi:hypothetical protein